MHRQVHSRELLQFKAAMADVADDADDFARRIRRAEEQSLAERVFVRENPARQRLAYDQDRGASADFLFGEMASAQQWNPHRLENLPIDAPEISAVAFIWSDGRTARDGEACVVGLSAQRQFRSHANRLDAGQRHQAIFKLAEE